MHGRAHGRTPGPALFAALLGLCLASPALAGDVVDLVEGPEYTADASLRIHGRIVQGHAARSDAVGRGVFYFLVRSPDEPAWTHAYRVDAWAAGDTTVRQDVRLIAADADPSTTDGIRLLVTRREPLDSAAVRDLVEIAVAAEDRWGEHKRLLGAAAAADAEGAHGAWRRIVRSLEQARVEHPAHLGILHDLIVAYTQLNGFERGTNTAANLARLIPARTAEFEGAVGEPSPAERQTIRRAYAMLYFEWGLYPLAFATVEEDPDDPELAVLRQAMAALGQAAFVEREQFQVDGELATCEVRVVEARGEPTSRRLLHDEMYFLTRPQSQARSTVRAWYTLSRQALDGNPRYYLYGCTGESRSLLRMYGRERPPYPDVRRQVERAVQQALVVTRQPARSAAPTATTEFPRLMVYAAVAFVLLVVLAWSLGRRRQRETARDPRSQS